MQGKAPHADEDQHVASGGAACGPSPTPCDETPRDAARPAKKPVPGSVVLVVEDDQDVRDLTVDLLVSAGYLAMTAADGEQALAVLAKDARPDAILLDMTMPVMSGWEFLAHRAAAEHLSAIPVIATTASDFQLSPDVTALLAKPYGAEQLLRVLRAVTGA